VALPPWPGSAVVGAVALVLLIGAAGLGLRELLRAVRAPLLFVVVGAVPLLFTVGGAAVVRFDPAGIGPAFALVGRATAALLCLVLFAATTPLADTLLRLERIGVPGPVIEVAALVYRMLYLLLATISTVREAQAGRLGFRNWRTTYRSLAGQAGAVFVGAFTRARRIEQALALRGGSGSLRVHVPEQPVSRPFLAWTAVLLTGVVTVSLVLA
jgi:cobalt/nickel transport system permease protein